MYERNPFWNAVNRAKLGISLDLHLGRGPAAVPAPRRGRRRRRRELHRPGHGQPRARRRHAARGPTPASSSPRCPGSARPGRGATTSAFAFPTEEVSGLAYLNGERGRAAGRCNGTSVTDAMVAADGRVRHRGRPRAACARRARATYIDLSQIETLTTFIAGELVQARRCTGARPGERRGNERPGLCPHGLYPCRPAGQRLAIAVRDDGEWQRLCAVLGRPDLGADADAGHGGRARGASGRASTRRCRRGRRRSTVATAAVAAPGGRHPGGGGRPVVGAGRRRPAVVAGASTGSSSATRSAPTRIPGRSCGSCARRR